jgi:hypothetical protein
MVFILTELLNIEFSKDTEFIFLQLIFKLVETISLPLKVVKGISDIFI